MKRKHIVIISPASARENNGNWQTASRWAHFLRTDYDVTISQHWPDGAPAPALMIALHARRSAEALAAFTQAYPTHPSVLVLTGTDLYRDIRSSAQAQAALATASALVLLQPAGLQELAPALRSKAHVIYQSAPALRPHAHSARARFADICMVGHLREEKDPRTFMAASALVRSPKARLFHIGGALEAELGELASTTQAQVARYHWLGNLPHSQARQRLKRCHAMVIASRMEGGANVIIEAVTSGVPVIASDISGNRGMLGEDYVGYFAPGDAAALARMIERSIDEPPFYATLRAQCARRAALFAPHAEQAALLDLVDNLINPKAGAMRA